MRWRALSRLFAAVAAFISLLVFWYQPAFLERLDEVSRDIVFKLRDTPQASPEVIVIAIDEKSVSDTGRWPWDRSTQATLLEKLKSYSPKVIGLDIIYLHSQGRDQDQYLVESLSVPGSSVVGGYFFRDEQSFKPDENAVNLLFDSMIAQVNYRTNAEYAAIQFPFVEVNQMAIASHMQGFGFFNYLPEADGLIRRAPLILGFEDVMFPSLALKTLSVYFGEDISVNVAQDGFENVQLGNRTIPVDNAGRLSLNFYAENRNIKIVSASDVLWGELEKDLLKDKLVFVGVTELGIADVRPTPVSPNFPGVAVHATVAANVIQNFYIKQNINTVIINILLIITIPFVLILVIARIRKPLLQFMVFLSTLALTAFIFAYLLSAHSLLISLIYPLMATIIGYIGFQTYYVLVSQKHSKFLRTAFSTYVSPNVVEKLINSPEKLRLEGEKREITVLFSDVRDFTKFSEKLEPEQLVHVMNTYFDPMTDLVMDRQGTLDKYIGDALMAIYNAPLDVEEHALLAAETAV
ncbi:MAG: adenylate/guanylate cyclase domain-containing protein, partial [Gammaproteobacteria bacterium]|nr:adenylate/guanylate cyclase domain-containing protein [Gammaproteobacteria bacterium]